MQEYPVVKMKELHNYKVGDVVRIKKTGDLVVIDNYLGCRSCVLYEQYCRNPDSCHVKTGCHGEGKAFGGKSVYFKPVKE
jgi:threonine dehydrogenase-like Zn-dependent dehydrogenase